MKLERALGFICYVACCFVGYFKFGIAGLLLSLASCTSAFVYVWSDLHCTEEDEPEHDSCNGCKHNLGGGHCKINLEDECADGGGYEAWED